MILSAEVRYTCWSMGCDLVPSCGWTKSSRAHRESGVSKASLSGLGSALAQSSSLIIARQCK